MTIQGMHYDFKMKLNKIDSQQYRNLIIPEIDWLLNEAQEIFIKVIAEPLQRAYSGFETSQRTIDDLKTLVRTRKLDVRKVDPSLDEDHELECDLSTLDPSLLHFVRGYVYVHKKGCDNPYKCRLKIRQHDDMNAESPFDSTSVEWLEVNGYFADKLLILEKPAQGEYTFDKLVITYLKRPVWMHFAEGFSANGYTSLAEIDEKTNQLKVLTGKQDCELPPHTHAEIVDIAVMNAAGILQYQDYKVKVDKVTMNQT